MNLVFNELSAIDLNVSDEDAVSIIEKFIRCFVAAVNSTHRFSRSIDTCVDLNTISLSAAMPMARCRNQLDKDLLNRFRIICDRQSISSIMPDDLELNFFGKIGKGLLCAYQNNDVSISLATNNIWKDFVLHTTIYDLSDDTIVNADVYNLHIETQLSLYEKELRTICFGKITSINSVIELCANLEQFFPNLVFHESAKNQLSKQIETQHLSAVIKKLYEINEYFATWEVGLFEPKKFKSKISPQSQATLIQYKDAHTYLFGDKSIIVSYHLRYTGNIPGRIYFHPDSETRMGLICSLTTKLPTVRD